jgi:hydroxymethylpyrimidine/phosphomethylpyrimidine kinase
MLAVLSIAGSDSSGGAGIQADIKTISAHHMFAETAITALTAQNTLGVYGIEEATPALVAAQIDAVFGDIRPVAVKVGMVSSAAIIEAIVDRLRFWEAKNIVVDPVMVATSGARLLSAKAEDALKEHLIPLADIVTPNIPEAEALSGTAIRSLEDKEEVACRLAERYRAAFLVKGGHALQNVDGEETQVEDEALREGSSRGEDQTNRADDVLALPNGTCLCLEGLRIPTANTHGTGCTLSAAIACNMAAGMGIAEAARKAKDYVTGALRAGIGLGLGKGSIPLDHFWGSCQ